MDDLQARVLNSVKQLKEADLEAISDNADTPTSIVKGVCSYLTRYGYLVESEGKYKVTSKATMALYEKEKWREV